MGSRVKGTPFDSSPVSKMPFDEHEDPRAEHAFSMEQTAPRYVAGDKFFNYQEYGALRGGGEVTLFSKGYLGIVIAALQSAFVYGMMRYGVRVVLLNYLQLQVKNQSFMDALVSLPTSFSLFLGILTDVVPIGGFRRRSYMVVGAVISGVMSLGLIVLATLASPDKLQEDPTNNDDYLVLFMVLIMGALFGSLMIKLATDARVVELSQREPLTCRGRIQIDYLVVRACSECFSAWLSYVFMTYATPTKSYHWEIDLRWGFGMVAAVCLLPIPVVLHNAVEEPAQRFDEENQGDSFTAGGVQMMNQNNSTRARLHAFYRLCQQRAVWQIVLFLSIVLSTTRFYFGDTSRNFNKLVKTDPMMTQRRDPIKLVISIPIMLTWKSWFCNSSWRTAMFFALAILIVPETIRALLVLYESSMRTEVFFDSIAFIMSVSDVIINIFSFIPATEVAEFGTEGATIGLFSSFRSCLAVATRTLSEDVFGGVGASDHSTGNLTLLMMISFGIHAIAFLSLWLLPRQKLDAQQLRVYGGYSKSAAASLVVIFIAFFLFSSVINLRALANVKSSKIGSSG